MTYKRIILIFFVLSSINTEYCNMNKNHWKILENIEKKYIFYFWKIKKETFLKNDKNWEYSKQKFVMRRKKLLKKKFLKQK